MVGTPKVFLHSLSACVYELTHVLPLHPLQPTQNEIEETLERIKSHKGVQGVVISNADGVPLRPSKGMDDRMTHEYAANLSQLAAKARSVIRDLDPLVCVPQQYSCWISC